ncbi:emerin (Emery-Dreifuss muscular dystrophy) [Parambassis ranga]|uniref:Emerin (Emery-Dreifuss muscular dystrophy) n=1 Tax=Parambassis ranga TaxID=210632 RepID=A0A6P7IVV0_9TELE|nr:emerin [Parambassis ranga]
MSLKEKSNEELSSLLTQHNIKHGPIVDSTRNLYEKKLEKAMKSPLKASSDKTYYREEEEEVTYVTYHTAAKHQGSASTVKQRVRDFELDKDGEWDLDTDLQYTSRTTNHRAVRFRDNARSGHRRWKVVLALLLLAVLAAVLYYAYSHVTSDGGKLFGVL